MMVGLLLLVATVFCCSMATALPVEDAEILQTRTHSRLSLSNASLRLALTELDARLVEPDFVIFGLELEGTGPLISVNLPAETSVGEALNAFLDKSPNIRYELAGPRLVVIYDQELRSASENLLNMKVQSFQSQELYVDSFLSNPWESIPELSHSLFLPKHGAAQPSGYGGIRKGGQHGPTLGVHLENVTIRQILNHVVQAASESPRFAARYGWSYTYDSAAGNTLQRHRWRGFVNSRLPLRLSGDGTTPPQLR